MKYIALFFSFWLLSACSPAEPETPELPCPENWMLYEEGQKEDFQFQRIENMAKAVAGAQNIEGIYPSIFTEGITATEIRPPHAYREGYSNSTYLSYILDTSEIADSTLNTRYFQGELMIKPLGNEEKKITASFQIDLERGFPEPPQ